MFSISSRDFSFVSGTSSIAFRAQRSASSRFPISASISPKRAHATVGVLGAVSVATACLVKGSVAQGVAVIPGGVTKTLSVEHPTGEMSCVLTLDDAGEVATAALLRTARKLMDGVVFA